MGFLKDLDEIVTAVSHRAVRLYHIDEKRYRELLKNGFNFEL